MDVALSHVPRQILPGILCRHLSAAVSGARGPLGAAPASGALARARGRRAALLEERLAGVPSQRPSRRWLGHLGFSRARSWLARAQASGEELGKTLADQRTGRVR